MSAKSAADALMTFDATLAEQVNLRSISTCVDENRPAWVTRVLPEIEALKVEYQNRYYSESAALSIKQHREGCRTATNPNIWTHLSGIGKDLMVGKYDEAVEELGTMVGMGRGIGCWVGGDAGSKIEALIASIRAEISDKHPRFPSEAEIAAGHEAIRKVRYLRLEGMKGNEALRNGDSCFTNPERLELVTAEDDGVDNRGKRIQRDQYVIFQCDGVLFARQWNVTDGFHDRQVIYAGDDPFNRRSVLDLRESAGLERIEGDVVPVSAPDSTEIVFLPLEQFEKASDASYAIQKLVEQDVKDGVAKPVAVPAITIKGILITSTGGSYRGLDSKFDAWQLTPETTYQGPTTPLYRDEAAIKAGLRDRGDNTGLVVSHRGKRMVLTRKITVKASAPSLQYAVNLTDAKNHEAVTGPWRKMYDKRVRWVEKAGFVLAVFTKQGEDELTMLYYRNVHGGIQDAYVKDVDSFPGPMPDADAFDMSARITKADKRLAEDKVMAKLIEALRALS